MTSRQAYLLDQYHLGQLSESEQAEFDQLYQDESFRELLELGDDLSTVLAAQEARSIKSKLQELEHRHSTPVRKKTSWLWLTLIVLVLGITGYFVATKFFYQAPENPYRAFLKPYRNIYLPVQRTIDEQDVKRNAMYAYEQGDYKKTIDLFGSIDQELMDVGSRFYLSVALFMNEDYDAAKAGFQQTIESDNYRYPSHYYLLLIGTIKDPTLDIDAHIDALLSQNSHPALKQKAEQILEIYKMK